MNKARSIAETHLLVSTWEESEMSLFRAPLSMIISSKVLTNCFSDFISLTSVTRDVMPVKSCVTRFYKYKVTRHPSTPT